MIVVEEELREIRLPATARFFGRERACLHRLSCYKTLELADRYDTGAIKRKQVKTLNRCVWLRNLCVRVRIPRYVDAHLTHYAASTRRSC